MIEKLKTYYDDSDNNKTDHECESENIMEDEEDERSTHFYQNKN